MSAIPLGRGAFSRIGAPETRLVNMFYEQDPANQEDQVSFLQRPGTSLFATCGSGPIRGIFRQEGTLSGLIFVVSGTSLYKVDPATGIATQITGTVSGTGRVSMAGSATAVLIANDTGLQKTTATTLSTVLDAASGVIAAASVAYISGYFLVAVAGSQKIMFSGVGTTTFAVLDFFSAEFAPDDLRSINTVADYVYFLGKDTTEIWVPTGNSVTPFQRLKGRLFNVGTADKSTVVRLDNTLFWVGNDRIAYRLANAPTRISDHGIDAKLAAATNLRAWEYVKDGHGFWLVSTGTETLVYDVTTSQWTDFASYGLTEFRCHLGIQFDSSVIGADSVNGKLWLLDKALNQDDGGLMVRECTGAIDASNALVRCDMVSLDVTKGSAGLDTDPTMDLRVSDDWKTWSEWRSAPLGRTGDYTQRVAWKRLGVIRSPGRLFNFRTAANCNVVVRKARMNERL